MSKEKDRVDAVLHLRATAAATYYHTATGVPLYELRELIKDKQLIGYEIIRGYKK